MLPIRVEINRSDLEIPSVISNLTNIVPWSVWDKRTNYLNLIAKSNPLFPEFLHYRHAMELAFSSIKKHYRLRGKYPFPRTPLEQRFYSFAVMLTEIYKRLSPGAQSKLRGMLESGLKKEFGLLPLAYEMKVAAHLMSRGFSVCFHDLECGGGFDFLACLDNIRLEIECKFLSADIGRKLHRRKVYDLGGLLHPIMRQRVCGEPGGVLVRVAIPDRLTGDVTQHTAIADKMRRALIGGDESCKETGCRIEIEPFEIENSPFTIDSKNVPLNLIKDAARKRLNLGERHCFLHWKPGFSAVVAVIYSDKPDIVLERMLERLKHDAKRQFTGTLPSLLCVHMDDLTDEQLTELFHAEKHVEQTGLGSAMAKLLYDRPKLHCVSIWSEGKMSVVGQDIRTRGITSLEEKGRCFTFRSHRHESARDQIDAVFSAS